MTLKPKPANTKVTMPAIMSVRLTEAQAQRLTWLMERLNMTKTEVVQALIDQEYEAHQTTTGGTR